MLPTQRRLNSVEYSDCLCKPNPLKNWLESQFMHLGFRLSQVKSFWIQCQVKSPGNVTWVKIMQWLVTILGLFVIYKCWICSLIVYHIYGNFQMYSDDLWWKFLLHFVADIIKDIQDPEKPNTLEELNVVFEEGIHMTRLHDMEDAYTVHIAFTPTVPHCSLATLIGQLTSLSC